MYPGYAGGMNWGSVSIDPSRRVLVTVSTYLANYMRLVPRAEANRAGAFAMGEGREGLDAMRGIKAQANTPYGAEPHSSDEGRLGKESGRRSTSGWSR